MTSSPKYEEARKWIDSVQERWRLQILTKRFKVDKATGTPVETPTRIRRFVEGVPWALVQDSIRYLLSLAPYSGIIYNGVPVEGTYRPTLTTWKRDDTDEVNTPKSSKYNDGTYTLVQDLVEDGVADAYGSVTSESCSEEVVTEWHWDEATIEELPYSSEQGVTYAIQAVNRKDDGTFDYAVVRRVAKTQHTPRHVQSDDAVSHVEVETWNNAYGDPVNGFVDENGAALGVPEAEFTPGTKLEVQTSENEDCTYRVSAAWTTTKSVLSGRTTEKDQFHDQESDTKFGQAEPLPDAPPAEGGTVKRHESKLNPDGTYTTTESSDKENPVSESTVEVTVGRKGTRRTVVDRNQAEPASTEGVEMGGSVKVEKTPGKLYNNTVSSWVRAALMKVASVCKIDIFSHRHSKTEAGLDKIPEGDVTGSGEGGVVKTRTTQMDDDGSITETLETETEKEVRNYRESWVYGLFGRRHRVEHQHVPSPLSPPTPTKDTVGKTVVNEKTPGGLYNTTEEDIDRTADKVDSGDGCAKTVFEHVDTTTVRDPSGAMPGHVEEAGGGKHRKVTSTLNDDGSSTVQEQVTTEKKVEDAEVVYRRTAKAVIEQHTDRNTTEAAKMPDNAGETESHTVNPGGTRNVTRTKLTLTGGVDRAHCRQDIFVHEHDDVEVKKGTTADTSDAPAPDSAAGTFAQKESVVDDNGLVTTTTRVTTEHEVKDAEHTFERKPRGLVETITTKAGTQPAQDPGASKVGSSQHHRKTQSGRFDLTKKVLTASTEPDSAHCQKTVFEHVHDTVTMSEGKVDSSEPPSAGGGHYYEKTSDIDSDGLVKTVLRDHHEQPGVTSGAGAEETMLSKSTTTVSKGNSTPKTAVTASKGHIESTRSTRAPGGTYEVSHTVETAKMNYTWEAECSDNNMFKVATIGFCNLDPSNFKTQISAMLAKASRWASGLVNGAICQSARVSHSSSMNKFGLLDGTVTAVVEWPASALAGTTAVQFNFSLKEENVTPMHSVSTDSQGNVVLSVKNQITKVTRSCTFYAGYGRGNLASIFGTTMYKGSHFSYNLTTGTWWGTVVREERVEFDYSGETKTVRIGS